MPMIGILEIFMDEYNYVTYYTIKLEIDDVKEEMSETEKFYNVYDNSTDPFYNEFETIISIIDAMGHFKKGADECLFRPEDEAHALPSKRHDADRVLKIKVTKDSKLRLYCVRVTNEVVILLNGGVKETDKAFDSTEVSKHLRLAKKVANAIEKAIQDGSIKITGKEIINQTEENEIVLFL